MLTKWYVIALLYFCALVMGIVGMACLYGVDGIIRTFRKFYELYPTFVIGILVLLALSFIAGFFVILDIRSRD